MGEQSSREPKSDVGGERMDKEKILEEECLPLMENLDQIAGYARMVTAKYEAEVSENAVQKLPEVPVCEETAQDEA